jgi:hypothetical protein
LQTDLWFFPSTILFRKYLRLLRGLRLLLAEALELIVDLLRRLHAIGRVRLAGV